MTTGRWKGFSKGVGALMTALPALGMAMSGGPPEPGEPVTDPEWTKSMVDGVVSVEQRSLADELSTDIGTVPARCNEIRYNHYSPLGTSTSEADAVLVLLPGVLAGANTFHYLGRQLVYMADQQTGSHIEVVALERRSNCFEDLAGLNAAEKQQDTSVAVDYYYNGMALDGKTFQGFPSGQEVSALSEFGLSMMMEDTHKVINSLVPSQAERKEKVYVGGHSLGGFQTAYFAGWDFDGNPETVKDAGYRNVAGLVGLDTLIDTFQGIGNPLFEGLPGSIKERLRGGIGAAYPGLVKDLREGNLPARFPLGAIGFKPETFALLEMVAMDASWQPEQEATLLDRVDYSDDVGTALRFMHSKDLPAFLNPAPSVETYRFTNEALLGLMLDDNFMPFAINQFSMGFPTGGEVAEKNFPIPSNMPDLGGVSYLLELLMTGDNLYVASSPEASYWRDDGPLYRWANFDEVANVGDEYTTTTDEVSDSGHVARIMYEGQSNLIDWYFTTRIMVDVMAAADVEPGTMGINYYHRNAHEQLPTMLRLAGDGTFVEAARKNGIDVGPISAPGYNHMDVVSAAANRAPRRENRIFQDVLGFVLSQD